MTEPTMDDLADLVFRRYPSCPVVTIYVPTRVTLPNGDDFIDETMHTCTAPADEQRDGARMHFPIDTLRRLHAAEQRAANDLAGLRELGLA